ncbi:MAG TPA: hypothetical protein O0X25_04480 [Methanocorpusculum sp.]|nr:hypothetical protein [Methanocorpusculum sp.]HJJ57849.1 hypothetical protein [Methanocorpusculum sp.]
MARIRKSVFATRIIAATKVVECHHCSISCVHRNENYLEEGEPESMRRLHCAKGHSTYDMQRLHECPDWEEAEFSILWLYEKFYTLYPEEMPE